MPKRMGAPRGDQAGTREGVRRAKAVLLLLTAGVATLALAVPAQATFHLMKIREVRTGTGPYVELQMFSPGQNLVGGHNVTTYGATGTVTDTYPIPGNITGANAGDNQKTILIAGSGYSGPTADRTNTNMSLPAAGGAVCFAAEPVDCVSWGNFTGVLPSPGAGSPASPGGVTAGQALHRSIAAGCSTLLEAADDTNNSATDFSEQTPNPRPNSAAVVESECNAPNTTITAPTPPARTNLTGATFTFTATPASGATFECKLDAGAYESCTSPKSYPDGTLAGGPAVTGVAHSFQVKATNASGTDPSPATHNWTVDTVSPTMTINTKPADPSSGASATFTYGANEAITTGSTQCKLDTPSGDGTFQACGSATTKTYTSLANGDHTFSVRATDQAGNQSTPAEPASIYKWEVDNTLVDNDPPETQILNKPPNPSVDPNASFTYSSDEPNSTFECKLDGGGFTACAAAGITYSGLGNGAHTFQVRATDQSDNTDPTPAGYSWEIAAPTIAPPPVIPPPPPPPPVTIPDTTIIGKPAARTRDRTPTFRFRSSVAGAGYSCKVDRGAFKTCTSPFTTKKLSFGPHSVQVRAVAGGSVDPTPAKSNFKVLKPKKKKK